MLATCDKLISVNVTAVDIVVVVVVLLDTFALQVNKKSDACASF